MSSKLEEKRLNLAAQGLRKTAISLQAAVVSLLQAADALTAETDDNLVENNPLDVNLQDLLKGDINGTINKILSDALNNEGEALDEDQKAHQNGKRANGVKKPIRKPRPPRDPNAPTKPQNAFILFQKDVSNQVKAENQGKPWSEIVHLISTRWKALQKEEKEVYEHQYEVAKQRFEIENKAYMDSKDQEAASSTADANGHEESNNTSDSATPSSTSSTPASSDDDVPKSNLPVKLSKKKSNVHTKDTQKFKKRKSHDDNDNDNESAHEEEENEKHSKKKKKEGDEIHDQKKVKKNSREVDEEGGSDREEEGKKRKKNKKKNKRDY